MSFLALYRKYRPTTFDKLIGQDHIVKTLVNQIESGRIGHAYLFTGSRGTGKTSCAKIFAKAINCQSPVNGSPCGKCPSCVALSDPSNIDVIEIDAASNNGVNEIRDLREKVQYPPVSCRYKVYIIDEVHMLTGPAFNALLKTLEEPPKHAVFILATTEVHKIPATILSRCMRFDFRLVQNGLISDLIVKIFDEQGRKYEKEAIDAIAGAGEGSVRDALSIADTVLSYGEGMLTFDDVMQVLGACDFSSLYDFCEKLSEGDAGGILELTDKLLALGKSEGVLIKDVTSFLRNLLIVKTCKDAETIITLPKERIEMLKTLAGRFSEERLIRALEIFTQSENSLKYSTHPRVIFETASVKATRPDSDCDFFALSSRVAEVEKKLKDFKAPVTPVTTVSPVTAPKTVKNSVEITDKIPDAKAGVSAGEISETDFRPVKTVKPERPEATEVNDGANFDKPVRANKPTISEATASDIKGKILFGFRNDGREMLWNMFQSVKVKPSGNTLNLIVSDEGDETLLNKQDVTELIYKSLDEFAPFTINVVNGGVKADEIDEETERLKKIFGDNIVILKD